MRRYLFPIAITCAVSASPAFAGDKHITPEDADIAVTAVHALIEAQGGSIDKETVRTELDAMFKVADAGANGPNDLPEGLMQAARLAIAADNPASRGVALDCTRDILVALTIEAKAEHSKTLAAWNAADPMIRERVPGQGMAQSDIDAFERLKARMPGVAHADAVEFWDTQDKEVNRMFPTKLAAWEAGVAEVWDELDDSERRIVVGVLDNKEVPPKALIKKVTGADDILAWIAVVNLPLTKDERKASPDLVDFAEYTAFAGPLQKRFQEIILAAARNGGGGGGGGMNEMFWQQYRLNNWSAMTGEMYSWDSYRYMTQGY